MEVRGIEMAECYTPGKFFRAYTEELSAYILTNEEDERYVRFRLFTDEFNGIVIGEIPLEIPLMFSDKIIDGSIDVRYLTIIEIADNKHVVTVNTHYPKFMDSAKSVLEEFIDLGRSGRDNSERLPIGCVNSWIDVMSAIETLKGVSDKNPTIKSEKIAIAGAIMLVEALNHLIENK